jgi:hypothetical protein
VADLFGDAELKRLPAPLRAKAQGALVTVVVGSTFHGTLAPAPADKTPKKEPAYVRSDPAQTKPLLKRVRKKLKFRLMVPSIVERSSAIDRELPLRVYSVTKGKEAVRLTFLASNELSAYWGIEETSWNDAPVLDQPNFKHKIKGREYYFYYNGAHLHMVVLRTQGELLGRQHARRPSVERDDDRDSERLETALAVVCARCRGSQSSEAATSAS